MYLESMNQTFQCQVTVYTGHCACYYAVLYIGRGKAIMFYRCTYSYSSF